MLSVALLLPGVTRAQLDIPVSNIDLGYPSISSVTFKLGSTTRSGLPTPLVIDNYIHTGLLWFCLDPLQNIYYEDSGLPNGSVLHYASTNPSNFDKWTPSAPGLTAGRIQDLADLFKAYTPNTATNAGAMQIAIWEIVNEFSSNPYDVFNGQMDITSGNSTMLNLAQTMLNSLGNSSIENKGTVANLDFLIDGTYTTTSHHETQVTLMQDLVTYYTPTVPVPEPSTYALYGAICLGLIVARRRFQRYSSAM